MRIIRFVTSSDGGSRFEELDIPFPQPYVDEFGNTYHLTRAFPASGLIVDLPHGLNQDWHVAPSRQIVIVLCGRLEVETARCGAVDPATCSWPTIRRARVIVRA
jgi:hypothetical protein